MSHHARRSIPADQTLRQRVAAISDKLIASGMRYDAAPLFPRESVDTIVAAGLHKTFAPGASGGQPFDDALSENAALLDVLRGIGRADLSLGRLFEGHVNALKLFAWYGGPDQRAWLGQRLDEGQLFGVWATEPPPGVTLVAGDGGTHLQGNKSFASGAGGLGHAVVTARMADGRTQLAVAPADDPARADLTGWRVRGMRATVSGSYDLSGLPCTAMNLLGQPDDYGTEPRFTAGAWRFTAVHLGGIEALLAETRRGLSEAARSDPLQRLKFGQAVVAARTAYLWVREAAQRAAIDSPDAPAFAQMTRGVVERAGLDVMELAARMIGTRSAFDGQRIDKIIRDLSLYLRQAGPDFARDQAALAWLDRDVWGDGDELW
ncbi:acyl-CoA dehydrogenase [Bosea sp. AAP35]|uniref:acyl-CoA dehydrogenase family protein n=1 Tax=Bosea sp. AAP35 TaxID=1523417 RepID=UPI0006B9BD9A|nr:acyl-CoA dehydrogenase family protein [Bosea sp. AAP35]KPF67618.1 acyl-CoA dehydrogenase [Bosea sp. AAP35]